MTTVDAHTAPGSATTRTRLLVDPRGDALEAAKVCEADVFDARYGDGRQVLDDWFATHEHASVFVSLVDDDDRAVGCGRVILPGPAGLKAEESLVDDWGVDPAETFAAVGLDPATTWEVASISVRPRTAGEGVSWTAAVLHGLLELTRENGARAVVAVLDEGARSLLARLGIDFHALPGCAPRPYCGSPASTPVYVVLDAMKADQRRRMPEAHRLVTLGQGLLDVDVPPAHEFLLSPAVLDLRESVPVRAPGD